MRVAAATSERRLLLGWLPTAVVAASLSATGAVAYCAPSLAGPLLVAVLPLVVYAVYSIVESIRLRSKQRVRSRDQPSDQTLAMRNGSEYQPNVLRISRALFDQLDDELLQMLVSNRDFDSNDYERLMLLEQFNESKLAQGASDAEIRQLPLISVSAKMLGASKQPSCPICLSELELDSQVRMMPCFHHFHPQCIDPWLKDKAECPVCKFPAIG